MASISEIQQDIVEEFDMFDQWMDKYEHIIDLGKSLPLIDAQFQVEANLIKGCQSHGFTPKSKVTRSFLLPTATPSTKGIIALMIRVFSHQNAKDIVEANTDFITQIGLKEQLSPTRANGLLAMVKQMKICH